MTIADDVLIAPYNYIQDQSAEAVAASITISLIITEA